MQKFTSLLNFDVAEGQLDSWPLFIQQYDGTGLFPFF